MADEIFRNMDDFVSSDIIYISKIIAKLRQIIN